MATPFDNGNVEIDPTPSEDEPGPTGPQPELAQDEAISESGWSGIWAFTIVAGLVAVVFGGTVGLVAVAVAVAVLAVAAVVTVIKAALSLSPLAGAGRAADGLGKAILQAVKGEFAKAWAELAKVAWQDWLWLLAVIVAAVAALAWFRRKRRAKK